MSSMSPGKLNSQKIKASTTPEKFHNSDVDQTLEAFKLLIQSCYGPNGYLKTIQNSCGGQVMITSSSSVLVRQLSVSRPILKLILAAVGGHIAACSDGGLFCALLTTNLVKSCRELDLHPVLCIEVNELLLKMCGEFLDANCVSINVSDVQTMLSLVRTVISTKPACGLSVRDTNIIANLTLQAFLNGLPSPTEQSLRIPAVRYILVEGQTPAESSIVEGVLIECPEIPTYATKERDNLRRHSISVALYNTSLSGDEEGIPDIAMETKEGVHLEDASLNQLLVLGRHLVQQKIGLLACQKVVHPQLKRFLRSHGVLTIDRLSLLHIDAVQTITGARVLGTLQACIPEGSLGHLDGMVHLVMHGKSYFHLQNPSRPVSTFVLCNRTESSLDELKATCSAANHVLALTLSHPMAVPGAGCFEACLAAHLHQQSATIDSEVLIDLGCTRSQFKTAANNFIHCIEQVARATEHGQDTQITDSIHHHRWPLPRGVNPSDWLNRCACGMKSFDRSSDWQILGAKGDGATHKLKDPVETKDFAEQNHLGKEQNKCDIQDQGFLEADKELGFLLDSFVVKQNALHVAVETANIVLRIHHTIEDR
ncbi:molecular chaperone MKKS-like [Asterias amurensis]|uniref:molecular chaperone MKKS-like n=1 Tax=Asterias amurensis TaxID=7602 RepID=UPI003AB20D1D